MEEEMEDKLRRRIRNYSAEELLREGKKYAADSRYFEARVVFAEGTSRKMVRETSGLYLSIILSVNSSRVVNKNNHKQDNSIIDKIVHCMMESTRMHAEKTLSNEDLFILECLIDRVPFKTMVVPNRDEFESLYSRFKEYVSNVFLR